MIASIIFALIFLALLPRLIRGACWAFIIFVAIFDADLRRRLLHGD